MILSGPEAEMSKKMGVNAPMGGNENEYGEIDLWAEIQPQEQQIQS